MKDFEKQNARSLKWAFWKTKCPHTFLHSVTRPANALEFSGCPVFYVHRTDLWAIGFNDKLFPLGGSMTWPKLHAIA